MIHVNSDLLGAPLGGNVLSTRQRRAPSVTREADEILGDQRDRTPRAPLPRGVGRRVDDNLPDNSPPRVVRIATRDEKPCQGLGHPDGPRI